jgi:CRISPR-associated protein Cmr6
MTAHQGHYFQRGETPHDSGSPNPINFLTVPPKSKFAFHVLCDGAYLRRLATPLAEGGRWQQLVEAAFGHAFQWLGFGAKTAVGYGALAPGAQPTGPGAQPAARATPATARAPVSEGPSENWDGARLQYNARNGTLTAIAENGARANAFDTRAQDLLSGLPEEGRQRVLANQFVRVAARVRGSELIHVAIKPRMSA